jgi:hypothetical protein
MAVIEPPVVLECITRRTAFLRLWLLGISGALMAAAGPMPNDLLAGAGFPAFTVRAITFVNTSLLLAVLVGLGTVAAREVGLYSVFAPQIPVSVRPKGRVLHWAQAALIVGAGVALAQVMFDAGFWALVPKQHAFILRQADKLAAANPLTQVMFRALMDELMLRWGLMSGLLWLIALFTHSPARQRPRAKLVWLAIIGVSVFYMLGQIPAILGLLQSDPAAILLVRTALVSALAGIAYGWLYWKHGLEAAVLGHVLASLGLILLEGQAMI